MPQQQLPQQQLPRQQSYNWLTTQTLRSALDNWHGKRQTYAPFDRLYLYRKLQRDLERSPHFVTNMLLLQAFDEMERMYKDGSTLLKRRYWDQKSIAELAEEFHVSVATIHNRQRKAIGQLQRTLLAMEQQADWNRRIELEFRLGPQSNDQLVGIAPHVQTIVELLRDPNPPWIVALEGLGGIGKTTLARAIIEQLLDEHIFDDVGWVSAKREYLEHGGALAAVDKPALSADELIAALARQLLPDLSTLAEQDPQALTRALHTRFKKFPHLIVIDNLETVIDVEALLPTIQGWANPTKFVLTSRDGLYTQPNLYHFIVPELDERSALTLLRQEIEHSHLTALAGWPDDALRPIHEVVGGNPLALRLVVAQAHFHNVDSILNHLRKATNRVAENLYVYIYLHAWTRLTQLEQDLLLVMALVDPDGDALSIIAEVGEMAEATVAEGLNQLVRLSLVDVRGDGHHRRYSIHGLTRTFLHEQVLRW